MAKIRDDFDNPWKTIITKDFHKFMYFFFLGAAEDIDWDREIVFLDKEFQQIAFDAETGASRDIKINHSDRQKNKVVSVLSIL